MKLHKEGYPSLLLTLGVLFAANALLHYFLPEQELLNNIVLVISVLLFLTVLQFFRNPTVQVGEDVDEVLAPADGKVVVIERTKESEYFGDERLQISIFMSPINVHVNRNPIAGVVRYVKYHAGKYLVAWHPKSSTENERTTIVVEHPSGVQVLFRQIAGALAKRIVWYVKEGQKVNQGSEFGFIKFGSRVDVYLPPNTEPMVQIGEKTKGGRTVLAKLK
jgi:phosphatidylserine decarboxylase